MWEEIIQVQKMKDIKENEIATLSSKVRNDRGKKKILKEMQKMDSRLRGNDRRGAGMT